MKSKPYDESDRMLPRMLTRVAILAAIVLTAAILSPSRRAFAGEAVASHYRRERREPLLPPLRASRR